MKELGGTWLGSGKADSPYLIGNAADLTKLKNMGAEQVIRAGQRSITLEGPIGELEPEITEVHRGFWSK